MTRGLPCSLVENEKCVLYSQASTVMSSQTAWSLISAVTDRSHVQVKSHILPLWMIQPFTAELPCFFFSYVQKTPGLLDISLCAEPQRPFIHVWNREMDSPTISLPQIKDSLYSPQKLWEVNPIVDCSLRPEARGPTLPDLYMETSSYRDVYILSRWEDREGTCREAAFYLYARNGS